MEVRLEKKSISYYKNLFNSISTHEETMETIVPDALPDILGIVDTDGSVVLRSKEAENGKATLGGMVNATILYVPEGEEGVCRLEVKIPFTATYDSAQIDSSTRLIATARIASIDSRIINPRKILVRVDVLTDISGWAPEKADIYDMVDAGDDRIEVLRTETKVSAVTDVREKTFVVSDEFSMPTSGAEVSELMKARFAISAEDTKTVGSKLIIKGSVTTALLYRTAEGNIENAEFTTVFSQIAELDSTESDASFDVCIMPTGVYFDLAKGSVTMELHAVAQITATDDIALSYIADTYSTLYEPSVKRTDCKILSVEKLGTVRETLRKTMETAVAVRTVLDVSAFAGKAVKRGDGDSCVFEVPLTISVLYLSADGRILSAVERTKLESAANCEDSAAWAIAAISGEPFAASVQDGIELRVFVDFTAIRIIEQSSCAVSMISWDPEAPKDTGALPSLVVKRTAEGDTLWSMAKKYNSTINIIEQANELEDGIDISAGQLLIIPRRR